MPQDAAPIEGPNGTEQGRASTPPSPTGTTVESRWPRHLMAAIAFAPWLAMASDLVAYRIGMVWLLAMMFLWPALQLCQWLGFDVANSLLATTWPVALITLGYCAAMAWVIDRILRRGLWWPERLPIRRALFAVAMMWLPFLVAFGYRVSQHAGLQARDCAGRPLTLIEPYCDGVDTVHLFPVAGFADRTLAARLQTAPGWLDRLAADGLVRAVPTDTPRASIWQHLPRRFRAPDRPSRRFATEFFEAEERGRDGDHYLFVEDSTSGTVYVLLKANF